MIDVTNKYNKGLKCRNIETQNNGNSSVMPPYFKEMNFRIQKEEEGLLRKCLEAILKITL